MQRVTHLSPVSISHPVTGQFIAIKRGDEFPDDDPIVVANAYLFVPDDEDTGDQGGVQGDVQGDGDQAAETPTRPRRRRRSSTDEATA